MSVRTVVTRRRGDKSSNQQTQMEACARTQPQPNKQYNSTRHTRHTVSACIPVSVVCRKIATPFPGELFVLLLNYSAQLSQILFRQHVPRHEVLDQVRFSAARLASLRLASSLSAMRRFISLACSISITAAIQLLLQSSHMMASL